MDFDGAELNETEDSLATFYLIEAEKNDPNFMAENFLGKDFYAPSNRRSNINILNSIDTVAAGGVVSNTNVGQQINLPNFSGHGQFSNTPSETSGHIPQRTQLLNSTKSKPNHQQPLNKVEVRMLPQVYQALPSAEVYSTDMHAANAELSSLQFEPTELEDDSFVIMRQHTKQCDQRNIDDTEIIVVSAEELKESSSSMPNNSRQSRGSSRNLPIRVNIDKENINVSNGKRSVGGKSSIEIRDALRDEENTGLKPHTCKVCHRSFGTKSHLSAHLLVHTGEKPFTCDVCYKLFSQKGSLTRHLLNHTGAKPFACDVCNKSFSQKSHLTVHLLIHTGAKPFACDVCNKSFSQKSNLTKHLLIHTGAKPFACDFCKKAFSQKSHLTGHLLIHTGEKSYNCEICERSFRHKITLTEHLLIHTGEKPFACKVCNKSFRHERNLSKHSKIHTKSN